MRRAHDDIVVEKIPVPAHVPTKKESSDVPSSSVQKEQKKDNQVTLSVLPPTDENRAAPDDIRAAGAKDEDARHPNPRKNSIFP